MRPLARSTNAVWQPKAAFNFVGSQYESAVTKVMSTPTPRVSDVLDHLDAMVTSGRLPSVDEKIALPALANRLNDEYRTSAAYVIDELGSYCAYCELPMRDPIQVEHVVPKSQYPTFQLDWENLVPACSGCNSRKLDNPKRALVNTWIGSGTPSPLVCKTEIRNHYRWPDADPVGGFFEPVLHHKDSGGNWVPCTAAQAVEAGVKMTPNPSVVTGEVRAHLPHLAPEPDVPVAVLILPGDGRAKETIDLCKLARPPAPRDHSDRRSFFRTQAWFAALENASRPREPRARLLAGQRRPRRLLDRLHAGVADCRPCPRPGAR